MSLSYTTLTVLGGSVASRFSDESLPALPFAYFATVPDALGRMVLYPESVADVPNAGDFAAAVFSSSLPDAVVVLARVDTEDTLRLRFFGRGESRDEYRTEPGLFTGEDLPPSGGNIERLARLFGITEHDLLRELSEVLGATRLDEQFGYGEAKERHAEIADLLSLPPSSVGIGFEHLQRGLTPEAVSPESLRHFPKDSGMQESGLNLRQYALFNPAVGESEARIAARFLPDVIDWEDDFLGEPDPALDTIADLRAHLHAMLPDLSAYSASWVSFVDDRLDLLGVDLGTSTAPVETAIADVAVFTLSPSVPGTLLSRLCAGKSWAVWSYETRQTVVRSA
ncbi:MAG: hypothetical protein H7145_23060 [Akkermansiaceae bacterium]|nr:hypothetical protein [Armatimonadota bacterium]